MTAILDLINEVNAALTECRASDPPGTTTYPYVPAVMLRRPRTMAEVNTFGKGETVPCVKDNESRWLNEEDLSSMLKILTNSIERRRQQAALEEIRRKALTVLTKEELDTLLASHYPVA